MKRPCASSLLVDALDTLYQKVITDGRTDGRTDRLMDGPTNRLLFLLNLHFLFRYSSFPIRSIFPKSTIFFNFSIRSNLSFSKSIFSLSSSTLSLSPPTPLLLLPDGIVAFYLLLAILILLPHFFPSLMPVFCEILFRI